MSTKTVYLTICDCCGKEIPDTGTGRFLVISHFFETDTSCRELEHLCNSCNLKLMAAIRRVFDEVNR